MLRVDVVAGRQILHRRTKFACLAVPERRNSGDRSVAQKIEQEDVELVLLQRRRQRQNVAALRPVSVAHDDRRRAPQSGKEEAVPRASHDRKRYDHRMPHHRVYINRCRIPLWTDDLVKEKARNRCDRNKGEQQQRQQSGENLGEARRAQFEGDGHPVIVGSFQRAPARRMLAHFLSDPVSHTVRL